MTKFNKNRSKVYTPDEITEAMEVLRLNNYNVSQTSKTTGVSRVTLSKWRDEYHSNLPLQERLKQKENDIADKGAKFREIGLVREGELINKALRVEKLILDRIEELIPEEKNMDRLSNVSKTLLALATVPDPGPTENRCTSIYQQVTEQLIHMKKEKIKKDLG